MFIHGFGVSHEMWDAQVRALGVDWRTVAYDLRGHGRSGIGDGQHMLECYVDDLVELLDCLQIDRAVLCGLSMGGYIALRTAERDRERVAGLVLASTRSEADNDEARRRRADSVRMIKRQGVAAFADAFLDGLFSRSTVSCRPEAVEAVRRMMEANTATGLCGALLAMASRTDTSGFLPELRVPALVVAGKQDVYIPPKAARDLHARIPDARLEVLAGAGHFTNLEAPDAFNAVLAEFVALLRT